MILKELKISGFGPFYEEQPLKIEPDVTVLTGSNDVGKSAILDILQQFWSAGNQDDVNEDRIMQSGVDPSEDASLRIVATYLLAPSFVDKYPELSNYRNWEVDVHYRAMHTGHSNIEFRDENRLIVDEVQGLPNPPVGIDLANSGIVRSVIPGSGLYAGEETLLSLAFGSAEKWQKLDRQNSNIQNTIRDQANDRLAFELKPVELESLGLTLKIDYQSRGPLSFIVALEDRHGGRAGPHLRGAGYQKLIGLMLALRQHIIDPKRKILVYDEPENSLHANAQHLFRRVLEAVSQHEHIQVVYATHSPAMINPARPKSLRLIYRDTLYRDTTDNNVATSRIVNKTYTESNFQSVRAQLGVLPADSLMFASITVIVEGPTERLSLNNLIAKIIRESSQEQHAGLNILWKLSFVVSANGSGNIPYWIEFARGQGVDPIVLVDGDKISEATQWKKDFKDVSIFHLDARKEFEDLVPPDTYIGALAEVLADVGKANDKVTLAEFNKWWQGSGLPEQMMFSKRVENWLRSEFETCLDKPIVMDRAIERVDFNSLNLDTIDQLIDVIRKLANDPV